MRLVRAGSMASERSGMWTRAFRATNAIRQMASEAFGRFEMGPEALQAAHRMLEEVSIHNFGRDNNRIKLKISVAAAAYPEDHAVKESDILELADQALSKAKELGGNRVYSTLDLHTPVGALHRSKNDHPEIKYLKEKMERLNKRANQSLIEAISAFAKTIELKDHYTGEHVERTVHFATEIAMEIGLSREEVHSIRQAAILHDLGKVGISEKILRKPAKLTPREFKEIKEHPLIGADIIRPIHMLHDILPFILYHHERWDGKGYPMGLKGEEIPIGARIISIADTWQALISNRPYRKAFGRKEALEIMGKTAFSLVFMDMEMPVMDGLTAVRALRAAPWGKEVPVVAFSAHDEARKIKECSNAGCTDYLVKPVKKADLRGKIEMYIKQGAPAAGTVAAGREVKLTVF